MDLLYMEEIKLYSMKYLFHQTKAGKEDSNSRTCIRAMLCIDEVVHASYIDDLYFNHYEFVESMVLDNCFLLELFISGTILNHQIT